MVPLTSAAALGVETEALHLQASPPVVCPVLGCPVNCSCDASVCEGSTSLVVCTDLIRTVQSIYVWVLSTHVYSLKEIASGLINLVAVIVSRRSRDMFHSIFFFTSIESSGWDKHPIL